MQADISEAVGPGRNLTRYPPVVDS